MQRNFLSRALQILKARVPVVGFDTSQLSLPVRAAYIADYDAARVRLEGATVLRESGRTTAALILYREGYAMLARAHAAATEGSPHIDDGADPPLRGLVEALAKRDERAARALRESLPEDRDEPPDRLPPRERELRVEELSTITPGVLLLTTPEAPEERRLRRNVWRAAIAFVVIACLAIVASYALHPTNIALHKPATSSSVAFNTKPSGAVNGRAFEPFGFHSNTEASPWLRIDLGKPFDITRILVYGRHDCCFDQSIPMAVEVSNDGKQFHVIAERHRAFDQVDPWEVTTTARARFVRLRRLKAGLLVLSEVEVYGKPAG